MTVKISQSDAGRWHILSGDGERILSSHRTAREAATRAIYDYLDATRQLILVFTPYEADGAS